VFCFVSVDVALVAAAAEASDGDANDVAFASDWTAFAALVGPGVDCDVAPSAEGMDAAVPPAAEGMDAAVAPAAEGMDAAAAPDAEDFDAGIASDAISVFLWW
jgi:hypothetical protein